MCLKSLFLKETWIKIWDKLDGNKTLIGFILLTIDEKLNLPRTWWYSAITIVIYIWTGIAIGDKLKKYVVDGSKSDESKKY